MLCMMCVAANRKRIKAVSISDSPPVARVCVCVCGVDGSGCILPLVAVCGLEESSIGAAGSFLGHTLPKAR